MTKTAILRLKDRDVCVADLQSQVNKAQLEHVKSMEKIKMLEIRLHAEESAQNSLRQLVGIESADRQQAIDQFIGNLAAYEAEKAARLQQDAEQQVALEQYRATTESQNRRLVAAQKFYEHMKGIYESNIGTAMENQLRFIQSMQASQHRIDSQRAVEAEAAMATTRAQMATWVEMQSQAAALMAWSQQQTEHTRWVLSMTAELSKLQMEARTVEWNRWPSFINKRVDPWLIACWNAFGGVQHSNPEAAIFLGGLINKTIEDRTANVQYAQATIGEDAVETLYVHPNGTVSHQRYEGSAPITAPQKATGSEMVIWGAGFQ
jgi:hypothetical protein